MGIQINGTNDTISANDGSLSVAGLDTVGNLSVTGDLSVTSINSGPLAGSRNRIINGDMRIDQRYAGVSTTSYNTFGFVLDRFAIGTSGLGTATIQRVADAPVGFSSSLKWTTTGARTPTTSENFYISQPIETLNVEDLSYGTASAETTTLSFYVKSSLTGTFGCSLQAYNSTSAVNPHKSYVFNYTINSANTWEYKTQTIPGNTLTTLSPGSAKGLAVGWSMGAGSGVQTSILNTWGDNFGTSTTATSVISTLNATFQLTGVQLEVGSVATPFERRPYGQELALCQRYYYKVFPGVLGKILATGGNCDSTIYAYSTVSFPVTMRTAPSTLEQTGTATDYAVYHSGTTTVCSAVPAINNTTSQNVALTTFTVASGLTVGRVAAIGANSASAYLAWSAEL